ncbi:hypothetical protein [Oceanidesulfovibrio marinus]|uniref:Uncharacterized protein n=1 Tax=Oceanidesulfovibrio marinus TaxID=370038 RepID=A0ABX6NGN9_9BACT|nr:hypothetical protein [Oceanidesulfovibrio marinus]QJT08870.1 hypothetical protein E8L03_07985 [Oceanidesulfovibrio marinus]
MRNHPIAGPLLDSAIAIEGLALGYVAVPLIDSALSTAERALAMNAPILPKVVDFVSGMLPGMPENEWQQWGYLATEGVKYLEDTRSALLHDQIYYDPDEYNDAI